MANCLPWEGPHAGAGAECEEEGAAETKFDELTAIPIPLPLRCLGGGGGEIGSEVKPRKKGGVGLRCFKVSFLFFTMLL